MHREQRATRANGTRDDHRHFPFEGLDFPVSRDEIAGYATDAELGAALVNLAWSLPDRTFASRDDLWRAMGEATRRLGGGGRDLGTPRDDIGKEASDLTRQPRPTLRHP